MPPAAGAAGGAGAPAAAATVATVAMEAEAEAEAGGGGWSHCNLLGGDSALPLSKIANGDELNPNARPSSYQGGPTANEGGEQGAPWPVQQLWQLLSQRQQ